MKKIFNKKNHFVIVITCFLMLAAGLTFFSKTFYYSRLPEVTVVVPAGGKLKNIIEGSSLVTYQRTQPYYSRQDGYCKAVYVEEGEQVAAGQLIMELETDLETVAALELEQQQKEQEIQLLQLELQKEKNMNPQADTQLGQEIFRLETKLQELNKTKADLEADTYTSPELEACKLDITYGKMVHEDALNQLEAGTGTQTEVNAAIYQLYKAQNQYDACLESLKKENTEAIKTSEEELAALQQESTSTGADSGYLKTKLQFQIENAREELNQIKANRTAAENPQLTAKADGIISGINIQPGNYVEKSTLLYELAADSQSYQVVIPVPAEKIQYVVPGNEIQAEIAGLSDAIKGTIKEIKPWGEDGGQYQAIIWLEDMQENPVGRQAQVTITHTGKEYSAIIPKAALKKDTIGYYVLAIKKSDTIMGEGYIAQRVDVDLLDSDDELCAISGMIYLEPVMLTSSKSVVNGQQVRIS